jgi:diketogulonate reductase-like aldo/keto reductase
MYGRSERVLGDLLSEIDPAPPLFAATKVWTRGKREGIEQMEQSRNLWRIARFDLMQVHNLVDWERHLDTLREWKASGRIRYIGITTSHGSRHAEMERIMVREPIDFIQLTYNIADRSAEDRLLPLALERGIAVIANRPFDGGSLFRRVRGTPLPHFAAECDCTTWAQVFLKFIVSHPAITCAIPATSSPEHINDYMNALNGRLPDADMRERIARM